MTRASSNVLIDRLPVAQNVATDALWVVTFSLVTAICAQISIHLPFSPVPITGQTFAVLLSGIVLGWKRGLLSQVAYLLEGAAGFPVFADGAGSIAYLIGPSGGYLLTFPAAAALVGYLSELGVTRSTLKLAGTLVSADVLILFVGSLWLRILFHVSFAEAFMMGFFPFLIADILKVVLVGGSLPRVMRWFDSMNN